MPYVDREGTPEHTSHFESCGCAEAREAALRAECERMMQDHIRLCTALGLDADAHIDMLAEAAERLRAENERLIRQTTADAEMLAYRKNEVAAAVRIIQGKDARIAELEAALTEIHELLSNYRHGKAKARAAAALKGDTSEIRRRASPDDKHPEDRIVH